MLKLIALLAVLTATACTDDVLTTDADDDVSVFAPGSTDAPEVVVARPAAELPQPAAPTEGAAHTGALDGKQFTDTDEICDLLPADGACAFACDPDALVDQFVPK